MIILHCITQIIYHLHLNNNFHLANARLQSDSGSTSESKSQIKNSSMKFLLICDHDSPTIFKINNKTISLLFCSRIVLNKHDLLLLVLSQEFHFTPIFILQKFPFLLLCLLGYVYQCCWFLVIWAFIEFRFENLQQPLAILLITYLL